MLPVYCRSVSKLACNSRLGMTTNAAFATQRLKENLPPVDESGSE